MLQWSDDLAVGIREIDDQHKELIARVNALGKAMQEGRGQQEIGGILAFLQEYVVTHFGSEEQYMTRHNYPGLAAHQLQHHMFVSSFTGLKRQYEQQGASSSLLLHLFNRVCEWLVNHIKNTDQLFGQFARGKVAA
ncbi:MAG: bacteriohemerythrin [Armatimonadota bacterium]